MSQKVQYPAKKTDFFLRQRGIADFSLVATAFEYFFWLIVHFVSYSLQARFLRFGESGDVPLNAVYNFINFEIPLSSEKVAQISNDESQNAGGKFPLCDSFDF